MEKLNTFQKLVMIQNELKAPKNQYNSFGKYKYRSCEDILESIKPLLLKYNSAVILTDAIKQIGERYYVEATVRFINADTGETLSTTAYAREEDTKKGMDGSQVTGASSSYARKYALNGMFDIDDTKDSDVTNTHTKESSETPSAPATPSSGDKIISDAQRKRLFAMTVAKFGKEKTNEILKAELKARGYDKTDNLPTSVYNEICAAIEKMAA